MRLFQLLLLVLLSLLFLIVLAGTINPMEGVTGIPHPEFKGMFISPTSIDEEVHSRWLGYLFGLGILALFTLMLLIGNRKKGKVTTIGKWIMWGMAFYIICYTLMVFSNWNYVQLEENSFFGSMPKPTAWMIYIVWFVPLIITISYIVKFEEAIISEDEIRSFKDFLKEHNS